MMRAVLSALRQTGDRFAGLMTAAACVALVIATLHIVLDVFMTRFFRSPLPGTHDIVTTYYMVALFFLPLAHAERKGAHIKADLFFSPLPYRVRQAVAFASYAVLGAFLAVLTWQMTLRALRQTRIGDMRLLGDLYLVLWPSRWLAVLGLAAFTVVAVLRAASLLMPGGFERMERKTDAE